MKKEFNLFEKRKELYHKFVGTPHFAEAFRIIINQDKEFIKRRLERIDLIIKLYPHKSGKELAGQLKEDLMNDTEKELKK